MFVHVSIFTLFAFCVYNVLPSNAFWKVFLFSFCCPSSLLVLSNKAVSEYPVSCIAQNRSLPYSQMYCVLFACFVVVIWETENAWNVEINQNAYHTSLFCGRYLCVFRKTISFYLVFPMVLFLLFNEMFTHVIKYPCITSLPSSFEYKCKNL